MRADESSQLTVAADSDRFDPQCWRFNFWIVAGCLAACAVAWFLRTAIASEPLWLDEQHTAWVTGDTLSDVAPRARIGNQNPLFFQLVYGARLLAGDHPSPIVSIRMVSIVSGLLLVLAVGWLVWSRTRNALGVLVAVSIAAVDPLLVFYSTEARPYGLVQFLSVVQVAVFLWCFPNPTREPNESEASVRREAAGQGWFSRHIPVWCLAIVSSLLIGVHITAIWIGVAELVWLILRSQLIPRSQLLLRKQMARNRFNIGRIVYAGVLTGMFCLPWIVNLNLLASRRENWSGLSSITQTVSELRQQLALAVLGSGLLIFAWLLNRFLNRRDSNEAHEMVSAGVANRSLIPLVLFCVCWAFIPVACVVVLHLCGVPIALPRYTMVGAAAFAVMAGVIVAAAGKRSIQIVVATLLLTFSLTGNGLIAHWYLSAEIPRMRFEDWEPAVSAVNDIRSKRHQPVFVLGNILEDVDANSDTTPEFQDYLLFPVSGLHRIDRSGRDVAACPSHSEELFSNERVRSIFQHDGAWLILRLNPQDREQTVCRILAQLTNAESLNELLTADNQDSDLNGLSGRKISVSDTIVSASNDVSLISISIGPPNPGDR